MNKETQDTGRRKLQPGRTAWILLGILLLAGGLRAARVVELSRHPELTVPIQDAEYHHYWARGMASGNWTPPAGYADPEITTTPYFRPPGYPFFLGLVYKVFGAKAMAGIVIQMLFGMLNVWLVYLLGRRLLNAQAGLIAAFLSAVWWVFIFSEGTLLDPTLHAFFLLLTLLSLLSLESCAPSQPHPVATESDPPMITTRRFMIRLIISGLLLGITCLIRPTTLLMIPVCAGWIIWTSRGPCTRPAVIFILAAVAAIAPVTIRNYIRGHDRVLISSNAGLMLYMGNSEDATGLTGTAALNELQSGKYRSCFDYAVFVKKLGLREGRPMKHSEASAFLSGRAWESMRRRPLRFLARTGQRLLNYLRPAEISHNHEMHFARMQSALLKNLPGSFSLLLALAVPGFVISLRHKSLRPGLVLASLFTIFHLASLIPFVYSSQYRIAMLPLMILFAAAALHDIGIKIIERNTRRALPAILGATGIYLAGAWGANAPSTLPQWHYQQAFALERLSRPDEAARHYQAMIELDPGSAWAHGALGRYHAERGRIREAIVHFSQALKLEPDYPKARSQLGSALYLAGRKSEGILELRRVLMKDPDDAASLNALAWILASDSDPSIRNPAEAVRLAERACELTGRKSAALLDTLAAALAALGDTSRAVQTAEEALAASQNNGSSELRAGILHRLENYRQKQ